MRGTLVSDLSRFLTDQMTQQVGPVPRAAFQAIAEECALAVDSLRVPITTQLKSLIMPSAGSQAAAEEQRRSEVGGRWHESPIRATVEIVTTELVAMQEAMEAYSLVLRQMEAPLFVYQAVGRSAVEYGAECLYLGDPRIEMELRAKRTLNSLIRSEEYFAKGASPERAAQANEAIELLRSAKDHFSPRRKGSKPAPPFWKQPGVQVKERTDLILALLGDGPFGRRVYSTLSAAAHGTVWGVLAASFLHAQVPYGDGAAMYPLVAKAPALQFTTAAVLVAARNSYLPASTWLGWPNDTFTEAWEQLVPKVERWSAAHPWQDI